MQHEAILREWFQRVWAERDTDAIEELFVPDGRARGLGAQTLVGPSDFLGFHSLMCRLLSDIDIQLDKCVEQEDWVSALCTLRGTCARSGRSIKTTGSVWARLSDGKLAEAYNHWDFVGMFEQLEQVPEGAFATLLSGGRMG